MGKGSGNCDRPALVFSGAEVAPLHKDIRWCLEELSRLGTQRIRICSLKPAHRVYLMIDNTGRTTDPLITSEDTIVEDWDTHNELPFSRLGEGRDFYASEVRGILQQLPDGCGDVGVKCALAGYSAGYDSGRESGRDEEYLSMVDRGY
jgi:hypothetical protein